MKNMLVVGMILVVLLVGVVMANAANKPDDVTIASWYVQSQYGPDNNVIITESEDPDYIEYYAVDNDGKVTTIGTISRSYCMQQYERNN